MTLTVIVALAAVVAATGCAGAWLLPDGRSRDAAVVAMVLGTAVLGLAAAVPGPLSDGADLLAWLLPVVLTPVGVLGGGPVTAGVLHLADRDDAGQVERAAAVLRGGAWIGVFERTGVFAALVTGWPEGIAVVLGLKGLGRYSELRSESGAAPTGGVAERFIIGTFCSVLWAAGAAGMLMGLVG